MIKGRITLFGHDVTNAEPHRQARLGVAFVPERNKVFASLSVAENLAALGRLPRRTRRAELSDFVFTLFPVLADRGASWPGAQWRPASDAGSGPGHH